MKKSSAKAKATPQPPKMEYAGDMINSNILFKIGLTKFEAPMLKTIAQRIYNTPVNSAKVARALLMAALAHYDALEPLMFNDVRYSLDEGFLTTDTFLHGLVERQHEKLLVPVRKPAKKKGGAK